MSGSVETFQVSAEAAEVYEARFVPALFGEWAEHLVGAAEVAPGQAVLDVACGTGVVARAVADRLGRSGRVAGVDVNEGMLAVARRIRPDVEWHHGDAADLPFGDASFDAVLCQAALMYFPDRVAALAEMRRVVKPGGTVAVQVWSSMDAQTGYQPFAGVVARHAGSDSTELIGSYFSVGDPDVVRALFERAGMRVTSTRTRTGAIRFGSVEEFVRTEIDSTPLADRIDEEVYARIVEDAGEALQAYVAGDGSTAIPLEGHIIVGRTR